MKVKKNDALESWRKSLSECTMKMEKQFSKNYYCESNLEIFSAVKDDAIKKAQNIIKNIDKLYDSNWTKKAEMEDKPKNYLVLLILMQWKAVIIWNILNVAK